MNYNKKTRAELIKIAQDAEKEIRSLQDNININNGVILELRKQAKKDEEYYDNRYSDHSKTVQSLVDRIKNLKNRNLIQRILNK